jgi:uncharacterized protein YndB with AHSA1/START domain
MNDETKSTRGPMVMVERTYPASVEEVWELWTTKEGFESWWGPVGFRVEVSVLEARPGGALHYEMIADTPEMVAAMAQMGRPASHAARATFSELAPHRRLVLTNVIDFVPGVAPYTSTIAVDLIPEGDRVRMVVALEPMHDEELTRMSRMGFESQLTKLDQRFAR